MYEPLRPWTCLAQWHPRSSYGGLRSKLSSLHDAMRPILIATRCTRSSAMKARAQAANQIQALLLTAPDGLKSELCGLSTARVVEKASRLRPGATPSDVEEATKFALRSMARR